MTKRREETTFVGVEKKKTRPKKPSPALYSLLLFVIAVLLIMVIAFIDRLQHVNEAPVPYATEREKAIEPAEVAQGPVETVRPGNPAVIPEKKPRSSVKPAATVPEKPSVLPQGDLVFVIDDVGNNLEQLDNFLKIPGPLTLAVMPQRAYSAEAVRRIKAAGKTAILHQPMEPKGDANPGKGAIYTTMTREEIWAVLDENLRSTGPVAGMNNHMGSRVTSDPATMEAVLSYLEDKGMFFLDSATTSGLVGGEVAAKIGTNYTKRNSMFLDNDNDKQTIYNAIKAGEQVARKRGHAVMIGHVMTNELAELLFDLYPTFIDDGFTLKDLSDLLHGELNAGTWD